MQFIELFAGVGGFRLGIQQAIPGAKCVYSNEWDRHAAQTYDKNFGGKIDARDITTVGTTDIPNHSVIVGGFPCQAFSIAGKRRGFEETRGTLFFEIARLLAHHKPKHLVLENVKGLLTHDGGRTYKTIIGVLADLGYRVEWQVLNSRNFGVPQNRERVFIVGHLRDQCAGQILPITGASQVRVGSDTPEKAIHEIAGTQTARQYASWNGNYIKQVNDPIHSNNRVYGDDGISPTLNTMQGGNRQPKVIVANVERAKGKKRVVTHSESDTVPAIRATHYKNGDNNPTIAIPVLTPARAEKRQNGRRFKENGEPAFTVNTIDQHGVYDGARIRRLTPVECERLQGFPDNWTEGVSETQRYKQMGNAVTVNVIKAIFERLDTVCKLSK